jgi:hypothetical protein
MRKSKLKTYDVWTMRALKSVLMQSMGDLYCFVWDLRNDAAGQSLALAGIKKSSKKCGDILEEIERRGH